MIMNKIVFKEQIEKNYTREEKIAILIKHSLTSKLSHLKGRASLKSWKILLQFLPDHREITAIDGILILIVPAI